MVCLLVLLGLVVFTQGRQAAEAEALYWGSSGDEVFQVQQKLSQWGYYQGPLDGYYGDETYRAVQNFQRNNGIPVDGVAGGATLAALGLSRQEAMPAVSRGAATDRGDIGILARVIEGEAADEPLLGKVAVGAVIMNRTKSASFPHTISGVIFQDHAFESISNGQAYRPLSQESIEAAQMAMSGYDPTGGAIFFWNPAKPVNPWIWSRNVITQIGNHVFAR
ncbi:spore cortex-lytic enzyme [Pelotomaculum propionicicum]|uniref:Spore cortex-lytic enzyme n=1 Tax=Pelotomaculum propionicicum TaxID=258475 RepID=A0A4Y7RY51_9FIRM|nr:spore cortex-lytic enzyme [Pelotomaculum propionicicum]TEB13666.1 Spore cortex-lytic enzyme [Pelotomaculum propionicicum]